VLNVDSNAKTVKGQKYGYMTGILYLAPAKLSGFEVCPMRSPGCSAACLNTAGRGQMTGVQEARIRKTKEFFLDKPTFLDKLRKDIKSLERKAKNKGFTPCVRLNGTSDIAWEKLGLMQEFPHIQFYDYTKNHIRMMEFLGGLMPKNYHLTFSLSEENMDMAKEILQLGGNVAMVFAVKKDKPLPKTHVGYKVINGDLSDLRFLDDKNVIVGLHAKGRARRDTSGFTQTPEKKAA